MISRVALSVSALLLLVTAFTSIPSALASDSSQATLSSSIAPQLSENARSEIREPIATVSSVTQDQSVIRESVPITTQPNAEEVPSVNFSDYSLELVAAVDAKPWETAEKHTLIGIIELVPSCSKAPTGNVNTLSAPGKLSPLGVAGTNSADLISFASTYNAIRVANCLPAIPYGNFRYDSCMEQRLFWMAEDPSLDPLSAWGHIGSQRSDGVPSVGCDGNLAGGSGNTGATVAQKWWDSTSHRASLYRPSTAIAGACINFAMTHGGVPNEPASFTRAAARWTSC